MLLVFMVFKFDVVYFILFIVKLVFGCSYDVFVLNISDNVGKGDIRKVWVGREIFLIVFVERVMV